MVPKVISSFIWLAVAMLVVLNDCANGDIDLGQINAELQQQFPLELTKSNLTLDDVKTLFKNKCVKVAGEEKGLEAYTEIEAVVLNVGECITNIFNYSAIQVEIEEASPRGELDVVFNRYCQKRPEVLSCIETFNAKLEPCLDQDELDTWEVFMRIVRSLLNFVCFKGGDQIALFIAEKGPECFESKKDDIAQCVNDTFAGYLPNEGFENIKQLPKLVIGQKQCEDINRLQTCINDKLERCPEITPANIVDSMFRFIKNETICRNTPEVAKQSGNSGGVAMHREVSSYFLIVAAISIALAFITSRMQA